MNKGSDKPYYGTGKRDHCGRPTINGGELMSGYAEYVDKPFLKKKCMLCEKVSICMQLVDLLQNKHIIEAQNIIKNM